MNVEKWDDWSLCQGPQSSGAVLYRWLILWEWVHQGEIGFPAVLAWISRRPWRMKQGWNRLYYFTFILVEMKSCFFLLFQHQLQQLRWPDNDTSSIKLGHLSEMRSLRVGSTASQKSDELRGPPWWESSFDLMTWVDFTKAFESVDHLTLIGKLKNLNIVDHIIQWVVAFLTDIN